MKELKIRQYVIEATFDAYMQEIKEKNNINSN